MLRIPQGLIFLHILKTVISIAFYTNFGSRDR